MFVSSAGRGLFAATYIAKKQFIGQYVGELLDAKTGNDRETIEESGYRFFFKFNSAEYWYLYFHPSSLLELIVFDIRCCASH